MAVLSGLTLVLGLIITSAIGAPSASPPIVDIGSARLQGQFDPTTNTTQFLGVRYAAPPVGKLRFQAPQPPIPVPGVQQANSFGQACPQASAGTNGTTPFRRQTTPNLAPEDCLFLNVFTPNLSPRANLPVIVWIHGGGYVAGSQVGTNGGNLVKEAEGGIVAVTIQYRLGVFGFLPGSEMKKNGVLNAGILDQHFALQWVQQHIAQFGGDPSRVTIWGESAGAGSVLQHVVAQGGGTNPPLFRGAIASSTFLPFQFHFDDRIPEQLFSEVAQQTNCASAPNVFTCIQNADFTVLQAANTAIGASGFSGVFVWVPVVDDTFILERPIAALQKRAVNGKFMLAVTNTNEGNIFVNPTIVANLGTLTNYVTQLVPTFNQADVNEVVQIYSTIPGVDTVDAQANLVMGELIFVCPSYFFMEAFPQTAHKGAFAIPPATHGEDVAFYLGGNVQFNNTQFITSFTQGFSGVIISGDPNNKPQPVSPNNLTPRWNLWNGDHTEMLFNETAAGQPDIRPVTTDPNVLERCQFWLGKAAITNQ